MKLIGLFVFLMLLSLNSFSGDFKGNGGSGILCQGQPLKLLDFYESKSAILLGADSQDLFKSFQLTLQPFLEKQPLWGESFIHLFQKFFSEAQFIEKSPLMPIHDTEFTPPSGCDLYQIVNQNPQILAPGKFYLVNLDLWSQLSADEQLGLILHEIIYRNSQSKGSAGIRNLVRLILTDRLPNQSSSVIEVFKNAGLPWVEVQGLQIDLNKTYEITKEGFLVKGTPIDHSQIRSVNPIFKNLQLRSKSVVFFENGQQKSFYFYGVLRVDSGFNNPITIQFETSDYEKRPLVFNEKGLPQEGPISWFESPIKTLRQFSDLSGISFSFNARYLHLFPSLKIKKIEEAEGSLLYENQKLSIASRSDVEFYENEEIESIIWGGPVSIQLTGQNIFPAYGSALRFYENQSISSFVSDKNMVFKFESGQTRVIHKGESIEIPPQKK